MWGCVYFKILYLYCIAVFWNYLLSMIVDMCSDRYDYLEFTDARGNKTKYDQKVNTEKWPLRVSFSGGSRLQFVFHSDSSNNEWGYKFKVDNVVDFSVPSLKQAFNSQVLSIVGQNTEYVMVSLSDMSAAFDFRDCKICCTWL